jgi:putative peptidoglycan lipid II flippase
MNRTERSQGGWLRDSSVAFFAGAAGRAAGFVVTLLVARRLGASADTDAFYLALSMTIYFSEIVRLAVEGAFVPAFVAARARGGRDAQEFFAGTAGLFALAGTVVAVLIAGAAATQAARGSFGPFSALSLRYLAWLAIFLVPALITAGANMVFYALHAFAVPALSPLVQSLTVLAALVLFGSTYRAASLVGGYLAGAMFQLAVLLILMWRRGVRPQLGWPGPPVVAACRLGAPIALGGILINANAVIDKLVAGWLLPPGNITILENAVRVYSILCFLSYGATANVFVTRWSELLAAGEGAALRRSFANTLRLAALLIVPLGLVVVLLSSRVVAALFGHGAYGPEALALTATCFAALSIGLPMFFVSGISARFLYSLGYTRIGLTGAAVALAVNVPADILLGRWLGVVGIAAATTLTYVVMAGYMTWHARARAPQAVAPASGIAYADVGS